MFSGFTLFVAAITAVSVAIMLLYMCFVSADRTGWRRLARSYRWRGRFRGHRRHFQSASLNAVAFHGVLVLGADQAGLFLRPTLMLRPFHPPLLIPWDDLRVRPFERTHVSGFELEIGSGDGRLELGDATYRRLLAGLDPAWERARGVLRAADDPGP